MSEVCWLTRRHIALAFSWVWVLFSTKRDTKGAHLKPLEIWEANDLCSPWQCSSKLVAACATTKSPKLVVLLCFLTYHTIRVFQHVIFTCTMYKDRIFRNRALVQVILKTISGGQTQWLSGMFQPLYKCWQKYVTVERQCFEGNFF
jgi:hypothetical protein